MTVMEEEGASGQGRGMPRRATGSIRADGVREKMWVHLSCGFHRKSEARRGKEASDWLV